MKNLTTVIILFILGIGLSAYTLKKSDMHSSQSIYNIKINSLMGESIDLNDFKGKKILFVNVASKCGYTPQYEDLQTLSEKYKDQLVVIGVPCNQFGGQEPGNKEEIATFCEKNYGVTFLMTEKVNVKGEEQHPLYHWLTNKTENHVADSKVKWNFQKYLIDEKGNYMEMFSSGVKPLSKELISNINWILHKPIPLPKPFYFGFGGISA